MLARMVGDPLGVQLSSLAGAAPCYMLSVIIDLRVPSQNCKASRL
jgi:hypothetical protein